MKRKNCGKSRRRNEDTCGTVADMKLLVAPQLRLGLGGRRPHLKVHKYSWPSLLIKYLIMVLIMNIVSGCGPGRGAGRRRGVPKLKPLVFKQHVPNISENGLGASGSTEGRIVRDDPRFKDLMPNYNADIIFKDEEGTGADRFMTQRCKERLNTLAISVMNQWPGVKLRVTEGWDEEGHHAAGSLHYEGRAVDVTTSDRDRSKYGMLAKLAVEAGFDWVYYESRSHIHCSVKSESSTSVKSGGCFPGNAKVTTKSGELSLSSLQVGDEVLVMDAESGEFKFSEVLLFLDRNPLQYRDFVDIETSSGRKIQVTPSHLIIAIKSSSNKPNKEFEGKLLNNISYNYGNEVTSDTREKTSPKQTQIIFSSQVEIGDKLITVNNNEVLEDKVVSVNTSMHRGVFAPLTAEGTVVVNEVVTSCYAVVNSHNLAHFVYGPLRLYHSIEVRLKRIWESALRPLNILKDTSNPRSNEIVGIHWYAKVLYTLAEHILPSKMLYHN